MSELMGRWGTFYEYTTAGKWLDPRVAMVNDVSEHAGKVHLSVFNPSTAVWSGRPALEAFRDIQAIPYKPVKGQVPELSGCRRYGFFVPDDPGAFDLETGSTP